LPKTKYTAGQIAYVLRQAAAGMPLLEVSRKMEFTRQSF